MTLDTTNLRELAGKATPARIAFRIRQGGQTVARAEGPPAQAEQSIMHYAIQYRQDGEITIQHNAEGHWKRFALLCQWPLPEKPDHV